MDSSDPRRVNGSKLEEMYRRELGRLEKHQSPAGNWWKLKRNRCVNVRTPIANSNQRVEASLTCYPSPITRLDGNLSFPMEFNT
ncbi:hypothetical protein HGM15179_005381 [Zosterops borbonicus]|uniref:Uncharacterized protein n=1 Tax=Zosterops borbonicus TaxID=364589 RepID=A0A8K1GPI3_9PASS|nr:hypothetical protein HGM15179_005381 [Zosterops borbonicus]